MKFSLSKWKDKEKKRVFTEEHGLLIRGLPNMPAFKVICDLIDLELSKLRDKNELNPGMDNEDIRFDFRYIAGQMSVLRAIKELPEVAEEEMKTQKE